jgi:HK97 family phage major capsid protein
VETQKVGLASVTFAPLELIKVISMSAAVRHTAIDAFEKYLVEELATCVLEQIAYELVNGQGSEEGEGLGVLAGVTWTTDNSVSYEDGPAYTDFAKMMGLLKRGYGRNAKWAMNTSTLYNQVYTLTDQNDRPIFVPDPRNDEVGRILGREVIIDDYLDDGVVLLGDWKYMGWNLANGIMIEVSRESSFKSGLIDYRALAIADTQVLVAEAFAKLSEAEG